VPPVPAVELLKTQLPIVCDRQGRAINEYSNTLHTYLPMGNDIGGLPLAMAVFKTGTGISGQFTGLKHLINDKYIYLLHACTSMDYKQDKCYIK
jgi:hypothetical protein